MTTRWRRALLLLAGLAGIALVAPSALGPAYYSGCTTIGCDDGLYVTLRRVPARPFTIAVTFTTARGDSVATRTCASDRECEVAILECPGNHCLVLAQFTDVMPSRAVVRVTTPHGWSEWRVRPRYAAQYPNGRLCGAACRSAMVRVTEP